MEALQWKVTKEKYQGFLGTLEADHAGQAQCRDGVKQDIRGFTIVWVDDAGLMGHRSGPYGKSSIFSVSWEAGTPYPLIEIGPDAFTKDYPKAQAYDDIVRALNKMIVSVEQPKPDSFSMKRWDGFYLFNLRQRKAGKAGKEAFAAAIDLDLINPEFAKACIERNFSMQDRRKPS